MEDSLLEYLPSDYHEFEEMVELQNALSKEVVAIIQAEREAIDQRFIHKATWGLDLWEQQYGIPTNRSKPLEQRRAVVMAKKRGTGTVTKEMLQNVAAAFSGGEVKIIEYASEYRFVVHFVGTLGIPPNIEDLTTIIEELKPAHLNFEYKYTYLTWDELDSYNFTWDELDQLNLTWNELEVYRP
ncbi:putative phage tail protein [Brevibacillus laterosporus]|uniref:putative phage tail protein n=1 Tax=Brevibacillus laterosporus TaxID=1465 RepID=UPI0013C4D2CE|nr:putative phage tail protein [Brevibacillus laterosporus]MBM7111327.1 hypothetical protein [Brevibacillus laterosporus]